MKFSVYYRIQQRDTYFSRFFSQVSKKFSPELVNEAESKYEDLMELVVKYLIDEDSHSMKILLTKPNAKVARMFFDYLTISNVKNKKKCDILSRIDEVYQKENTMIDFKQFLADKMIKFDLSDELEKEPKLSLNEADDDDPFADDAGGGDDDMGGDDAGGDPFADDGPGGGDGGSDSGSGDGSDGGTGDGSDQEDDNGLNLDDYEDDPDFTKGKANPDDVTLSDTPSGECIYDVEGIMNSLASVIQSLSDSDLAEIEMVKKAVELIFNGKILKPEDVQFTNPENASFLIKKIGSNVDEKTRNYLILKIKEPLIKQRDQQKLDIAKLKKDVNVARDTLTDLDK
jgi:hypothetical protein